VRPGQIVFHVDEAADRMGCHFEGLVHADFLGFQRLEERLCQRVVSGLPAPLKLIWSDGVVQLVRAGVAQVLAFDPSFAA
jgi:hypothetical protein